MKQTEQEQPKKLQATVDEKTFQRTLKMLNEVDKHFKNINPKEVTEKLIENGLGVIEPSGMEMLVLDGEVENNPDNIIYKGSLERFGFSEITEIYPKVSDTNNDDNLFDYLETLKLLKNENKITIFFEKGFEAESDTEDVFQGIFGLESYEENEMFYNAVEDEGEAKHTFFLSNPGYGPFSDAGLVNRLVVDNYWTRIILHDHINSLDNNLYVVIQNKQPKIRR